MLKYYSLHKFSIHKVKIKMRRWYKKLIVGELILQYLRVTTVGFQKKQRTQIELWGIKHSQLVWLSEKHDHRKVLVSSGVKYGGGLVMLWVVLSSKWIVKYCKSGRHHKPFKFPGVLKRKWITYTGNWDFYLENHLKHGNNTQSKCLLHPELFFFNQSPLV